MFDSCSALLLKPLPAAILFGLADVGEASVADLAQLCDRSHQSIAGGLTQLEELGLVRASMAPGYRMGRRTIWTLDEPNVLSFIKNLTDHLTYAHSPAASTGSADST